MHKLIEPGSRVRGSIKLPGDKSISHRALMFSAIASGTGRIENLSNGMDVHSTMACLEQLGVKFEKDETQVVVHGVGLRGLQKPSQKLDVGNSGTTIRLLAGILAGQSFQSVITGDESIRTRPMRRIIAPLSAMGAQVVASQDEYAPLQIQGNQLQGIHYRLPVVSAQVKSCILLAGLYADRQTTVEEIAPTRDHTELMLSKFGASVHKEALKITVQPAETLTAQDIFVPGDLSSAAFFIAAATLLQNSDLVIRNVGINPTRKAFLSLLCDFGADLEIINVRTVDNELMADLHVCSAPLQAMSIGADIVSQVIDEIPILAVMATQATGRTEISGAGELRLKESDRLRSIAFNLQRMGAEIEEKKDGLVIQGPVRLKAAELEPFGDHRIGLSFSIAALIAEGVSKIKNSQSIDISYPDFFDTMDEIVER